MSLSLNQSPTARGLVSSAGLVTFRVTHRDRSIHLLRGSDKHNSILVRSASIRRLSYFGQSVRHNKTFLGSSGLATSPLPDGRSLTLQSVGTKSKVAHRWLDWLHHPWRMGGSPTLQSMGTKSKVAHKWADWLHHSCRMGGPRRFRAREQSHKWHVTSTVKMKFRDKQQAPSLVTLFPRFEASGTPHPAGVM